MDTRSETTPSAVPVRRSSVLGIEFRFGFGLFVPNLWSFFFFFGGGGGGGGGNIGVAEIVTGWAPKGYNRKMF